MKVNKKKLMLMATIFLVIVCSTLSFNSVDNSLTEEDKLYVPIYLTDVLPLPANPTYREELNFIISVQQAVLNIAPKNIGLPFEQRREPKELYEAKAGLCYDRSRVIEKVLRYSGFETRHVSIYSKEKTGSAVRSLLATEVSSHAVTEVLTKEGWLVVDSNAPWVSTDANGMPISIEIMQEDVEAAVDIDWEQKPPADIYSKPFTFVYGLYSRHGRFYPPYNIIPDINYSEFVQNAL